MEGRIGYEEKERTASAMIRSSTCRNMDVLLQSFSGKEKIRSATGGKALRAIKDELK